MIFEQNPKEPEIEKNGYLGKEQAQEEGTAGGAKNKPRRREQQVGQS